jgi:hypothetical protein
MFGLMNYKVDEKSPPKIGRDYIYSIKFKGDT